MAAVRVGDMGAKSQVTVSARDRFRQWRTFLWVVLGHRARRAAARIPKIIQSERASGPADVLISKRNSVMHLSPCVSPLSRNIFVRLPPEEPGRL